MGRSLRKGGALGVAYPGGRTDFRRMTLAEYSPRSMRPRACSMETSDPRKMRTSLFRWYENS